MLMWCMDKAPKGLEQETPNLARRILLINFGAIHMTSTVSRMSYDVLQVDHYVPRVSLLLCIISQLIHNMSESSARR